MKKTVKIRCSGIKDDGYRCTRKKIFIEDEAPDEWRCWQHQIDEKTDIELTEKQKAFADEYIISLNAKEAAVNAGYSENSAYEIGYENLRKPQIKKYIDERLEEKEAARIATQDEVLEYLTKVMRGEIKEEQIVIENKGDFKSQAKSIMKQVGPKDRNKAAELLGKRYSLFKDNLGIDITGVQIIDDL